MTAEICYLWQHGQWLKSSHWPANDRGLHYGDGLFETLRFAQSGDLPLAAYHQQRLLQGLVALDFPVDAAAIIQAAVNAIPVGYPAGKLLLTRGSAPRGYLAPSAPQMMIQFQPFAAPDWLADRFPEGLCTDFSDVRLAPQPLLAGFKHLNRLEQVLARSRFPHACQEVVMLDADDWVIEGCMSNLFIREGQRWLTPDLSRCGVNGVVRRWLLSQMSVAAELVSPERLLQADAIFMTNTLNGITAVQTIGSRTYDLHPDTRELQQTFQEQFA